MRAGDRIAFQMIAAIGILVPTVFIALDRVGVVMPNLFLIDARLGLSFGTSWAIFAALMGVSLGIAGLGYLRTRGTEGQQASTEFSGWAIVAVAAMLASTATLGFSILAITS